MIPNLLLPFYLFGPKRLLFKEYHRLAWLRSSLSGRLAAWKHDIAVA